MKKMTHLFSTLVTAAALMLFGIAGAAAYDPAQVHNQTGVYINDGVVEYASAFCSDDDFSISPGGTWTASSRGACLITRIHANVCQEPGGGNCRSASAYTSGGTGYHCFAISVTGDSFDIHSC